MSKEDVINYVMTTPSNPNRAVLSGMLDSIAESGGGTVEAIKIASVNGGGSEIVSGTRAFNGGGMLLDSKTLGELVGNKRIVDFAFVDADPASTRNRVIGAVNFNANYNYNGVTEYESAKDADSCAVTAIYSGGTQMTKVDIYAICI